MISATNYLTSEINTQISDEERATQLIAEFETKKDTGKSFLDGYPLFGGGYPFKIDEAIECYQRAANFYNITKNWSEAGSAFCQAANLQAKKCSLDGRCDAATNYVNAANCFKKSGNRKYKSTTIMCFKDAIEIFTDMGRLSSTAKLNKALAEIYEASEPVDIGRAVQHYQQAAKYFNNSYSASQCLLKLAEYAAQLENYQEAIQHYEQVACSYLKNSLLKDSVKEYFYCAALCHLCVDVLNAQHALERYENMHPSFQDSSESKLVKTLICLTEKLKVAENSAQMENYQKAIQIYEEVAYAYLEHSVLKCRAKEYFFRAALCHLCVYIRSAHHALQKYENSYPALRGSREFKLVKTLIGHMETKDAVGFTKTVTDYDSTSSLDQWVTTILVKIKGQISECVLRKSKRYLIYMLKLK